MDESLVKEEVVVFQTIHGSEVRATLVHLTRHAATIEVYGPDVVIRTSEVLEEFRILNADRAIYSGRAVVREVVNAGSVTVCTVVLEDAGFDAEIFEAWGQPERLGACFGQFIRDWQKVCKVLPEFKVAVADIESFLIDLRRWSEQVELAVRSSPRPDRLQQERAVIDTISSQAIPVIDSLFERFEHIAAGLEPAAAPAHRSYVQRHLHPIVLCAPFAYRSYRKPLGYAGDYEIVNMMLRDPQEGSSLFAKIFNVWLLHQGSAAAHRNRVVHLKDCLVEAVARASRSGRPARILNIGCGPAWEVQEFLAQSPLSDSADFTLLDFNEETLQYTGQVLHQKQQQHHRNTTIHLVKRSVQQLLKDVVRDDGFSRHAKFDLVYCAGLFDYLPDRICRRLVGLGYQSLAPGGVVLVTNVAPYTPNRGSLELILDWHLNYRDANQVAGLRPEVAPLDACRVMSDQTGFNIFLEARHPHDH